MPVPPEIFDPVQKLHDAVGALIETKNGLPPTSRRMRGGIGLESGLAALLVWNLLVAFVVHFGAHVLGHTTCEALQRNRKKLEAHNVKAAPESKILLADAISHKPFLTDRPSEADRLTAVAALKEILVRSGRKEKVAVAQAERVVDFLITYSGANPSR